ncbi:hypothetical protein GGU11DRAFT_744757 [Lentinula aff. detonsa]|nr:hypothetical protein GGU11DRAFT_744757 [Lentinula aff. detonsa]
MALTDILCCFRSSSRDDSQQEGAADERTHLIPTTVTEDQIGPTPNLVFIDPVHFRDRLGTIVRAKEGRMVNVTPNYRSREQSLNRNSGFRASSRMSSTINFARTPTPRSMSASDDDSNSVASVALPDREIDREEEGVRTKVLVGSTEGEEENIPKVVVSSPVFQQKPIVPNFDDPSLKLSVSWGD